MKKGYLKEYFQEGHNCHKHSVVTFFGFLFLAFETVFSGTVATYSGGHVTFTMSLSVAQLICIGIYFATAFLVTVSAGYKYLVIPDVLLLAVKLYAVFVGGVSLWDLGGKELLAEIALVEKVVESLLFSVFLAIMLAGKMAKKKAPRFYKNAPFVCLIILAVCFPFTAVFEIIRLTTALGAYQQHIAIAIFNFVKGVINEIFLDIPYALLVLLIYFVPEKSVAIFRFHKSMNI